MASTNFINECKKRANANRLGKINIEGINVSLTQSNQLQSFLINDGCYIEGSIIGSIYIKNLTASLVDSNNVDLVDKKINAQIGVKYADGTTEYIDMGKYTIERPTDEKTANMSQITAYADLLNNIDNKYVCNIDYSSGEITLKDLYVDVCVQLGLSPKTMDFLNNDIPISNNPFGGDETNRIVLQTIAKIACSFVTIDNATNEIDLSWLSTNVDPDYTFEKSDYSTLTGGAITYGPVNSVTIKNSTIDDENVTQTNNTSIEENGEHSIVISEDYILYNTELRQQAITGIFERLNGLKYVDAEVVTYYGKPFLKIGDKIRIMTDDGFVDTYVLLHDFMYDGTFYSCIKSPVLTEQEMKTKQNTTLADVLRNAQIEINKQKQIITATVETQKQQSSTLDNLIKTIEGHKFIEVTNAFAGNVVYLNFYGYIHYAYPSEKLFPEKNLYLTDSYLIIEHDEGINKIKLPYFTLNYTNEVYDEFIIDNSRAYIIRRLDSNKQVLDEEIIEELGIINVPLKSGKNKIYMESFTLDYVLKYNVQNNLTESLATKTELRLTENSIMETVNQKANDEEIKTLIEQKIIDSEASINSNINKKFNDYSTTTEMNNTIEQKITDSENSITSSVNNKFSKYSTTTEMNNSIEQKVNESETSFDVKLSKKVDSEEYTSSEIFAKINNDTSSAGINADKIILTADDILNLLAGNTINLTSRNIEISSDNFSVKSGKMTCKDADIEGTIKSDSGTIGGWTINSNGLTNGTVFLNNDGSSTIYTVADLIIIRGYIMNTEGFELPPQMIRHYDLNGDGVVNSLDYVRLQNLIGISMS